ncbi:MAG: hypothetical protein JJE35_08080 [Thermoleophilia bacterium]|nr:hypothetical protein [Thermoleophilia bacterium]
MEAARKSWTDDRLDDLQGEMRRGFDRVDADVRDLRGEVHRGFARVDTDMRELRGELGAMHRTMMIGFAGLGAGVLASVAATVLAAVFS